MQKLRIGMIGVGNMGTAMLHGWLEKQKVNADQLFLFDLNQANLDAFPTANRCDTPRACVSSADLIFLCVKPQALTHLLKDIKTTVEQKSIVSIAAGIGLQTIEQVLPGASLARVMPNTPMQVGQGASAICFNSHFITDHKSHVLELFSSLGLAMEVTENLMDAVTGLSGSGPAYVFEIIDAMSDAAVHEGLPREVATQLAAQTLKGAAEMVLNSKLHPMALKDQVTSPAGTTIAGLHALEKAGLRHAIQAAILAATKRSKELSTSSLV